MGAGLAVPHGTSAALRHRLASLVPAPAACGEPAARGAREQPAAAARPPARGERPARDTADEPAACGGGRGARLAAPAPHGEQPAPGRGREPRGGGRQVEVRRGQPGYRRRPAAAAPGERTAA